MEGPQRSSCKMASEKLRVAVIGAGAAGLCAARHLLASPDMFAPPVVFEASDHLGGTWVYTEESGEDAEGQPIHSSMYHDLRTNLPKEVMAFPDFPFDPSLPSFLHHSDVLTYLESYAEHSGIQDHVQVSSRLRGCCSHLVLQLLQEVQLTLGSSVGGWGTKPELPGRQEQAASKRENGWLSNCPESIAEWLIGNIQSN